MRSILCRSVAVVALLALAPSLSQAQTVQPPAAAPAAGEVLAPQYARPTDPWIYRGTDIPVDPQWLMGELPNGVRYAVRENGVPPGQISIRVAVDTGSIYEKEEERGFAHLIEHLVFRQSRDFGNGEAIPYFQRLGAALGADTNATTSPTQTAYQLDLPNATRQTLEDSIRRFSGMIREPLLSSDNIRTELPIVLAERRERLGPDQRIANATRELFFAGQPLAERNPIGTVEALQGATQDSVRAFHKRWYRPERTVVSVVGDADPQLLAALVEKYFTDWQATGRATSEPDFGEPEAPAGADPENPVGETRVVVEPGQQRGLTFAWLRPFVQVTDNQEYNRGLLTDQVALAIINRRLEARARGGGSFLFAGVDRDKPSRSADGTFVTLAPLTEDWQAALADVRGVIADAVAAPPTQAEIDREVAEFDIAFANAVEQSAIQAGSELATELVNAVDIRESIASPETLLELFRGMGDRFNPDTIHKHTQALFTGEVIRAMLLTPDSTDGDADDLRAAMLAPVTSEGSARSGAEAASFAELPAIGVEASPVTRAPLGVFDIEKLTFANGVTALLWPTTNEPGRATVRVRFGKGVQSVSSDDATYVELGKQALVGMGFGEVDQNGLDDLATGRKFGWEFQAEDGSFVFEGQTRREDVADQLYLFAAKLADPRWDAQPFERARAAQRLAYESFGGNANGVLNRDLPWVLHDRDPRYRKPDPQALAATDADGFQRVWSRLLADGPVEVDVFGDFDKEAVVAALGRTFGAIPAREAVPAERLDPATDFPAANAEPVVLRHTGDTDQAAAVIAWPTGGGSAGLPESRRLEVLAQVFSNRLMDGLRERLGASYAPYVGSDWPLDVNGGGHLMALAQLPPSAVPAFFAEAQEIATDLAANGPQADELARVVEPIRQLLDRAQTGHTFWLNQLSGAALDPARVENLRSLWTDYTQTPPAEYGALAARYLGEHGGFKLVVLPPEGAATGQGAAAAAAQTGAPTAALPVGR
ncbi:insulinase family protein [Croceibacterium sp. TMG7-5b_MA50]|uniref:M16 family metallopeptidase n=1 Tax=Croceibacterium sp. TMG7-5b_MA50 TaxID=3121290 RepID=UPI003221F175